MEYEKLAAIISEVLNVSLEEITPAASFVNDFGADSLDIFEMILRIEEEFGIELPGEALTGVVTVSDVEELLKSQ
ncbi:acyl carrier protein [Lachnospiraceae bacterium 62-35]